MWIKLSFFSFVEILPSPVFGHLEQRPLWINLIMIFYSFVIVKTLLKQAIDSRIIATGMRP